MARLYNLARMTTATTGTGTITLGVAVAGYLTFAQAGVQDGDTVTYGISDGSNGEVGEGVYSASAGTLTRGPISSTNSNAAIGLSGTAQVFITPSHRHFFDQGTACLFQQSAAPTGWTKVTTYNDAALRVVSGSASSGGSNAFSTVMAQTTVGNTTLTAAQIPAHTHQLPYVQNLWSNVSSGTSYPNFGGSGTGVSATGTNTGGGAAHNHTITMNMLYVDVIIATKN
jgi:hypothetical protein